MPAFPWTCSCIFIYLFYHPGNVVPALLPGISRRKHGHPRLCEAKLSKAQAKAFRQWSACTEQRFVKQDLKVLSISLETLTP